MVHRVAALALLLPLGASAEYTLVDDMQVPSGRGASTESGNFLMVGVDSRKLWAGGRVNYFVNTQTTNPQNPAGFLLEADDSRIQWAVQHWEEKTCVRFTRCASEASCPKPYLKFQSDDGGCNSPVGVDFDGVNEINLGQGCGRGAVAHEIGHSMGLEHEQCRNDRDDFITVDFAQIQPSFKMAFHKNGRAGRDIGPYDYGSLMHYSAHSFGISGRPTIITPNGERIGQSTSLSVGDINAIHFMYNTCRSVFGEPVCIASRHTDRVLSAAIGRDFNVEFNVNYDRRVVVTYEGTDAPSGRMAFSMADGAALLDGVGKVNMRFHPSPTEAGRTFTLAVRFAGVAGECVSAVTVRVTAGAAGATAGPVLPLTSATAPTPADGGEYSVRYDDNTRIIARSGTITDGYGGMYPNDLKRSITVQAEHCRVEWLEFDVEGSASCEYDFVDIVDITTGLWWERYCGSDLPPSHTFTGDGFSIVFHTDAGVTGAGFKLRFDCGVWPEVGNGAEVSEPPTPAPPAVLTPVPSSSSSVRLSLKNDDGRTVAATSGTISDGFDTYPSGRDLSVTVRGEDCELVWRALDIEVEPGCEYDWVEVLAGGSSVGRYCGTTLPPRARLMGSEFTIVLHSDAMIEGSGFDVDFECRSASTPEPNTPQPPRTPLPPTLQPPTPLPTTAQPPVPSQGSTPIPAAPLHLSLTQHAGGSFAAQSGSITDGYDRYPASMDASVSVQGSNCRLTWRQLDVERSNTCQFDFVSIAVGGAVVETVCGPGPVQATQLSGDGFTLRLRSDRSVQGSGFLVDFACDAGAPDTPAPPTPLPQTAAPSTPARPTPAPETPGRYGRFEFERTRPEAVLSHGRDDFTQGFEYISAVDLLVEGTGMYGRSVIKVVDPATGATVGTPIALDDEYFGEGLTALRDREEIYQLTWQGGRLLVWGYTATAAAAGRAASLDLSLKRTVAFPETSTGEGWGICNNGTHFFVSDGSANMHVWTVSPLQEVARIAVYQQTTQGRVEVDALNELECLPHLVDGQPHTEILANVWYTDDIVRIDGVTGRVIETYDMSGLGSMHEEQGVLNGIAFDAGNHHLYITGKEWDSLYRFDVSLDFDTTPAPQTQAPATSVPQTPVPRTPAPPTAVPPTQIPPTPLPPTQAPTTPRPPTPSPTTLRPPTPAPSTLPPPTPQPVTRQSPVPSQGSTPIPEAAPLHLSLTEHAGGSFAAQSGSITDGYDRYPASMDASVSVQGSNCRLTWRQLDVERSNTCRFDFVSIAVGGAVVETVCGPGPVQATQLSGDGFTLRLRSDTSVQGSGFLVDFACDAGAPDTPAPPTLELPTPVPAMAGDAISLRDDAGGVFEMARGVISDGFDSRYPDNYDGRVTIQGTDCVVVVAQLDVEAGRAGQCTYDRLLVIVGGVPHTTLCGRVPPAPLQLSGAGFEVVLQTDRSVGGSGFALEFTCRA